MKINQTLVWSLATGMMLGGVVVQGLHAQAKPPVYAIIEIDEITDPATDALNSGRSNDEASATLANTGGRFLVRNGKITSLDGTPPKRVIVGVFDSTEKLQAWWGLPAQKKVTDIRMKSSKSRAFIVEGL